MHTTVADAVLVKLRSDALSHFSNHEELCILMRRSHLMIIDGATQPEGGSLILTVNASLCSRPSACMADPPEVAPT